MPSRSIFATRKANHDAVRQRNLRELDAKQGMIQEQGQGTTTSDVRPATGSLSLASLQDLSAIAIPPEDGQILEVWSPSNRGGKAMLPSFFCKTCTPNPTPSKQKAGSSSICIQPMI